jgi:flagellar biosynthesis/type III secretory pathway protein FliH
MDDEAKPYLLTEASGLTGLSVDALRKRIERKKLRGSRSNEDGQWRVWLTSKDVETAKSGRPVDKSGQDVDGPPDESRTIKAMEGEAAALRDALARERERADTAEGESATLREQVKSEGARAAQAEREREAARIAAAAAEGRAEGLRLALEEARRPFWRRWLG